MATVMLRMNSPFDEGVGSLVFHLQVCAHGGLFSATTCGGADCSRWSAACGGATAFPGPRIRISTPRTKTCPWGPRTWGIQIFMLRHGAPAKVAFTPTPATKTCRRGPRKKKATQQQWFPFTATGEPLYGCFAPSLPPFTAPFVVSFVLCQAFFVPCFVAW